MTFIKHYKKMINSKSHISVIADYQEPIDIRSQKAINTLINSGINADISIKVVCDPNNWETYYDLNNSFIEYTHDYGTIELNDCNSKHNKRLIKKHKIKSRG